MLANFGSAGKLKWGYGQEACSRVSRVREKNEPSLFLIGEKRKVALASSLIINPQILLLDEPTAGLDPQTTRIIMDLLIKGKTIITATHDLHIIEEISDLVYVFSQEKKIVRFGRAEVILKDTELLAANNLVHIHSHRHKDRVHLHPHLHLEHHTEVISQ